MTKTEFDLVLDKAGNGDVGEIRKLAMICYKMAESGMEHDINKAMEYMELGNGWKRASEGTYSSNLYNGLKQLTKNCFNDCFKDSFVSEEILNKIEQALEYFEVELFTGYFSESFIRNDLHNRATSDRLSTLGSRNAQLARLGIKKELPLNRPITPEELREFTKPLHLEESGFQTNELGQKKQFYYDSFDKDLELINTCLSYSPPTSYVDRLKRCQNQVNKLRDIVRNFRLK